MELLKLYRNFRCKSRISTGFVIKMQIYGIESGIPEKLETGRQKRTMRARGIPGPESAPPEPSRRMLLSWDGGDRNLLQILSNMV